MQTKADLAWLPDFEDVPQDEHGAPIVWSHITICAACNASSKVEASKVLTRTICRKCRSVVEIFPEAVNWLGPVASELIKLWKALPAPDALLWDLTEGFTAQQIPAGMLVADQLGNKIELRNAPEGLTVHLRPHHEGRTLSLLLDGADFTLIEQEIQ